MLDPTEFPAGTMVKVEDEIRIVGPGGSLEPRPEDMARIRRALRLRARIASRIAATVPLERDAELFGRTDLNEVAKAAIIDDIAARNRALRKARERGGGRTAANVGAGRAVRRGDR